MTDRSRRPSTAGPDQRRTDGTSSRGPSGSRRTGRRETLRPMAPETSPLQRWRGPLIGILGVVVLGVVGAFLFLGATQKTYACTQLSTPAPAATAAPDSSSAPLGQVQPDMGTKHLDRGASARYSSCPPASGPHYSDPDGPIPARYYGKDDAALPQGWIHNLEHGGIVILYRCADGACDDSAEQQLRQLVRDFPPSPVCGLPAGDKAPVVARFDDMATPFAALIWDRILLLDTLDTAKILDFYNRYAERTNPEPQCASPSPSANPEPSASPLPAAS